jgi:RNA polymerase sigma factor (sigma-70 family)
MTCTVDCWLCRGKLRHQEVADLHYKDGLSYREIARRLGIAHQTVGQMLKRAKKDGYSPTGGKE